MKALLIILLILLAIGLLPVGVDGGYNGEGLRLSLRFGVFRLRIFPAGRLFAALTKKKPEKAKKPKPAAELDTAAEKKPQKPKMDKDELFTLLKMGLKALGRFRRKLSVDYFRIHIIVASDDPYNTAMSYGRANAALCALVPLAENAFDIKERDFAAYCDFTREKSEFDLWLTASIQIWEILYVGTGFAIDLLNHKREKKRALKADGRTTTERTDTNGKTSYRRPDGDNSQQDKGNGGREHHSGRPYNNA